MRASALPGSAQMSEIEFLIKGALLSASNETRDLMIEQAEVALKEGLSLREFIDIQKNIRDELDSRDVKVQ
jgi:hypothetical protein